MIPRANAHQPLQQSRVFAVSAQHSHSKHLTASREANLSQGPGQKNRYNDDEDMLAASLDSSSSIKPMKHPLPGAVASPPARNQQLAHEGNRFQLSFKQPAGSQGSHASKSPLHVASHPFGISR